MIQDYLFINSKYYLPFSSEIILDDFRLDKLQVSSIYDSLRLTLDEFQKINKSDYLVNTFHDNIQEFVYDFSNLSVKIHGTWSINNMFYRSDYYLDTVNSVIFGQVQYTNLSHTLKSDYTLFVDNNSDHFQTYNILSESLLQKVFSFRIYTTAYSDEYLTLDASVSKIYFHQNKSNTSEYMTITRDMHVFNKDYKNYIEFNHQAFVVMNETGVSSYSKFYSDIFKQGYDGRIVYMTDDIAYYVDVHLKDNNLSTDDPSDQFVRLWTIDMHDFSNLTLADKLDADADNGNNRFNTEVRDENWDESVQGRLSGPGISDYIIYDSENSFGLLSLGYVDADNDDTDRILQYFKKYTIDTDNNTLTVSNITVDWNGFDQGFTEPEIFTTTDGPNIRRLWSNTQFLYHFIKNGTHYFVSIDYYIFTDYVVHGRLHCKNVTRFRFFKLIDQDNLKMLDEYTAVYDDYTAPDGSTNQDDLSVFYLHQTYDNIFHLINVYQPFRRIIFNTTNESIDVKDFDYWVENDYVQSKGVSRWRPLVITPYYAVGAPYIKDTDYIYDSSFYPLDYNIFNKYDVEINFTDDEITVDYDNYTATVNVKVKDIVEDQYVEKDVKLTLKDLGLFKNNHEKEIDVTVPDTGLNVDILLNPQDQGILEVIGYVKE